MDCVFCKIVKGDIQSELIYDDEDSISFLDISPSNKGHALVIPKKHYETIMEMPPIHLGKLMMVVQRVAKAVVSATDAKGFNVFVNNGKDAGQEVMHVHFHIVPRHSGDGHKFGWSHTNYKEGELKKYAEKIKKLI